ncbi:MAG: phosphatidylserine decarboxylase [Bacteroidales bacterium]|nr:phosphatidylserine decarboxylase [Bacteroidales bacterium]
MRRKKRIIAVSIIVILLGLAFYPLPQTQAIKYVERTSGEIKIEKVEGEKWLIWLYNNPLGELSLHALVKRKFVSALYGRMMDAPRSSEKIAPFVEKYNINLNETQKQEFNSFNNFFVRKLKPGARDIDTSELVVVSPGEGKILAYEELSIQDFLVKGNRFNIYTFLNDSSLAKNYEHGSLLIIRVTPPDYHRFHFPVSGHISVNTKIPGDYYSVSPLALRKIVEVLCLNKREYVKISTSNFGEIIMSEVGATMVGSIIQTYNGDTAVKGEEKGYFKFGGSTLVLLFEKGEIDIDDDLLLNTMKHLETEIMMGEQIAVRKLELGSHK